MASYRPEIEQAMKKYYGTLAEKDRRRYAAVEAMKLGAEGVKYIAQLMGCSEKTVRRGWQSWKTYRKSHRMNQGNVSQVGGAKAMQRITLTLMDSF